MHERKLMTYGQEYWGTEYSWRVLSYYIPFVTGPVSFFSSVYLVWMLLRKSNRKSLLSKPRDQLLLGLSFMDICGSFAMSFSTTPGLESVFPQAMPAYGNVATCEAQGFLIQMGFGGPLYNAATCLNYILSVRFKIKDQTLMKWFVPAVHVVNFGFITSTAIAGLFLDLYNPAGVLGCWIHPYRPEYCALDSEHCGRGENATKYELLFCVIHVGGSFCFCLFSMLYLTWIVHSVEKKGQRWQFQKRKSFIQRQEDSAQQEKVSGFENERMPTESGVANSVTAENYRDQSSVIQSRKPTAPRMERASLPLTRRTATTGALYTLSFLLVYLPLTLTGLGLSTGNARKYLIAATALLSPLQGFFNMLIYTSPVWLKSIEKFKKNFNESRRSERITSTNHHASESNPSEGGLPRSSNATNNPEAP